LVFEEHNPPTTVISLDNACPRRRGGEFVLLFRPPLPLLVHLVRVLIFICLALLLVVVIVIVIVIVIAIAIVIVIASMNGAVGFGIGFGVALVNKPLHVISDLPTVLN